MNPKATLAPSVFAGLLLVGTAGCRAIEGWPLSPTGKVFTSVLILSGVGALAYVAAAGATRVLDPYRNDGRLEFNPSGDVVPDVGDVLVVLGLRDKRTALARLAEGRS